MTVPPDEPKPPTPPAQPPIDPRLMRPADREKAAQVPPQPAPKAPVPQAPPAAQAPPAQAPQAPIDSPKANQVDPRLQRPAPAAKAEAPKEAPAKPSLGELFEHSLIALIDAPGVFFRLSARPAPGPGASFLVALVWGAAFFALNMVHVMIANPAVLRSYAPWQIGAVGGVGLALWGALYLLGSSLIYGLGRTLGAGDFDRALLVAAITLAAAPTQALCSWFPAAWPVPSIIAAWIMACGVHMMFKTDPWAARGACAVLAGVLLAFQYGAGMLVEKYAATARLAAVAVQAAPSANQLVELQQQMQQVQAAAAELGAAAQAPQTGQSGLDLLRGPAGEEAPPPPDAPAAQKRRLEELETKRVALNSSAAGMLDSLAPMLNNPALTQNMNAQQKADYAELGREFANLKSGLGKSSSPQENQARMLKLQQLMMRMMSAGAAMPDPSAGKTPPPPPAPPKP